MVVVGVKATRRTFLALQKVLISAPTCRPAPATIVTWPLLIVSDIVHINVVVGLLIADSAGQPVLTVLPLHCVLRASNHLLRHLARPK